MSNNISANKNLRIASRYVHTGNSGADFEIYRNDVRSDGAHFVLKIGAMGSINSEIEVVGDEFGGFTSDQLRDLANMFLYAADQLEKPTTEQTFQGRSRDNRIIPNVRAKRSNYDEGKSEEDMKEELYSFGEKGKHTIDDVPVDITQNIVKHGPGSGPIFEDLVEERGLNHKDLLVSSLKSMTDSLSSRADDHSFPKDPKDYEKKPKEIKDRKVAKRRSTLERLEEEKQRNQGDVGASFQTDTFGSYDDHDPFKELNEKEKWKAGIPYDCLGLFRTDNNPQTWAKIALNDTPLSKEERENLLQMKKKRDNYVSQSDKDEFVQKFSDNVKAPTYLFIRDQYRATRDDKKKKELGMVMESLWNSMNEEEKDKVRNKDKK